MKQPLLGKKLRELREQKGLTQEDLVEKCNVTVRTIQRIESGETNPRTYTVKILLNALDLDYEKIFKRAYTGGVFDKILRFSSGKLENVLRVALIAGIIYCVFGFVETAYYGSYFYDVSSGGNWYDVIVHPYRQYSNIWSYILIKTISVLSFGFFMRGFVLVGSYYNNYLVALMAFLMLIFTIIFEVSEILTLNLYESLLYFILISRAITFGILMLFFGIGIIRLKTHLGDLSLITGVLEIIIGVCFLTVFLSAIGLLALFPLELLELLVLYKVISKIKQQD